MIAFNNGVEVKRTGLVIPDDLPEREWEQIGRKLGDVETSYQWMVGDWWAYGEKAYGNRVAVVKTPSWPGPSFSTCVHCGVVARTFETRLRRQVLTFTHHKEIAPLMISKPQLAKDILDWCEEPLKEGKQKPRSVASMKKEIRKRLDKHFEPLQKTSKSTKEDFTYIEFIGPISRFAEHKPFDIKEIARVQIELFGAPEIIAEDISDCEKVIKLISEFLRSIRTESDQPSVPCCPECGKVI